MKRRTSTILGAALLLAIGAAGCSDNGGSPAGGDSGPASCATCVGADTPTWALVDFQPKSDKFETSYGLEAFRGKVLVVALLAGW